MNQIESFQGSRQTDELLCKAFDVSIHGGSPQDLETSFFIILSHLHPVVQDKVLRDVERDQKKMMHNKRQLRHIEASIKLRQLQVKEEPGTVALHVLVERSRQACERMATELNELRSQLISKQQDPEENLTVL